MGESLFCGTIITAFWLAGFSAFAADPELLQTGNPPTVSREVTLVLDPTVQTPFLTFDMGFATDETVQPQTFLDSLTVTLHEPSANLFYVYLTADAGGFLWAPETPGGEVVDSQSIFREPISFQLDTTLQSREAYSIRVPLDSSFAGKTVNIHFDLFDNGDGLSSLGWFNNVSVVPEPGALVIALAGLAALRFFRKP